MPPPSGPLPPEIVQGFQSHLFDVPVRRDPGLTTSAVQLVWNIPVILAAFSDQPLSNVYGGSPPEQFFQRRLFDTTGTTPTGSVFDYYTWVSGNRIRVVGKVVARVTLANPKNFYANNQSGVSPFTPTNAPGFVTAAVQAADSLGIDWQQFDVDHDTYVDMVWVVHSGLPGEATVARDNLWSLTSRLSSLGNWRNSDVYKTRTVVPASPVPIPIKIDRFSVLPELSSVHLGQPAEIGVYCHEFGHALGLPDLYDTSMLGGAANAGPGNWSLMSTGGYGTDGHSPEYPSHLGAWPLLFLGWRSTVRPTGDTLLTQAPLSRGGPVMEVWFQGESNPEHFLVENRQREGFDRNLPSPGLILYHVDETTMFLGAPSNRVNAGATPGLRVVEADGQYDLVLGNNHGDAHDPFPGLNRRTQIDDETVPNLRAFGGAYTNLALRRIESVGPEGGVNSMRYFLQVRAPGWQPASSASSGSFNPDWPSGPANRAVRLGDGSVATVLGEYRAGRLQIVLRSRPGGGPWGEPYPVSGSTAGVGARDPSIAALPNGDDVVVVWSDSRHGAGELYYRSRIGGVWSTERRLTDLPGDSRYPSVAVDRRGRVHLAWLYSNGISPQVRFMTFTYFSPFGASMAISRPDDLPDAPVVTMGPEGVSRIVWSNRATDNSRAGIWFTKYDPTVGLAVADTVILSGSALPAIDATVDASGALHIVWQVSGPGVNEIHYQRRLPGSERPAPGDTVLVSRGESVQSPALRVDSGQGLHLAFVANNGGVPQVRYKRWQSIRGWDAASTEVTLVSDGPARAPALVPTTSSELSVLYFGFTGGQIQQMERRRVLPASALDVPATPPAPTVALRLGPNPLRAGDMLRLALDMRSPGSVDVYDLTGRRIASAPLIAEGIGSAAGFPGDVTRTWPSGVYFVRVRDQVEGAARLVVLH